MSSSQTSNTAGFGLTRLTVDQHSAVFDAVVTNNRKAIAGAAFRALPGTVTNPKRIFGAKFCFHVHKEMPAFIQRDGETEETTPPDHAVPAMLEGRNGHKTDGWAWTKKLHRGAPDSDIAKAEVLEIVVPEPENDAEVAETETLLAALKTIVRQVIRYATNPTTVPPFPMTFVATRVDAPVRTGWLSKMENGKVAVWHTTMATGGYMIAGSGKDASQAVARTRNRLLDELSTESRTSTKASACNQTPRRYAPANSSKEARIRNFDAVLAASVRS